MKRTLLVLLLTLASSLCALAVGLGINILENYGNATSGISKTWNIAAADQGWAFFATRDAVYQYNGNDWTPLYHPSGLDFRSVAVVGKRVYVGSINEFGYFTPDSDGDMLYVNLTKNNDPNSRIENVWAIHEHNGVLYFQGDNRVLVYDADTHKRTTLQTVAKLDCSAMINGILFLGTDRGLKMVVGNKIMDAPGAQALREVRIRAILEYGKDILIITARDGAWRYNGSTLTPFEIPQSDRIWDGEVFTAAINGNTLALGTIHAGVYVVNLKTGKVDFYNETNGLLDNTVLSLSFQDGDLWTGLDSGIQKILLSMPVKTLSNAKMSIGSGYVAAAYDGKYYLGTNRGLWMMDPARQGAFTLVNGSTGQVWSLDHMAGDLLCSHDRGLFVVQGDKMTRIPGVTGAWNVQYMLGGDGSTALVGNYNGIGVVRKNGSDWQFLRNIAGFDESAFNIIQSAPGEVWINHGDDGVIRLKFNPGTFALVSKKKYSHTADQHPLGHDTYISQIAGKTYFATDHGIYSYNPKSDSIELDPEMNRRLGDNSFLRLKQHGDYIFALSDRDVVRASLKPGVAPVIMPRYPSSSAPVTEINPMLVINDSVMMYSSEKGYTVYDFTQRTDTASFPAYLARINEVDVTTPRDSVVFRSNFLGRKSVPKIEYSNNSIRIRWGSSQAASAGDVTYSYRLNGGEWSAPTHSTVKEYTNLREGKYTFEVRAYGVNGGVASDTFQFRILPPWYRSGWAIGVYILLAIALIVALFRGEKRFIHKKELQATKEKDLEIDRLESQRLQDELNHKSQEMSNTLMTLASRNEMLISIKDELHSIYASLPSGSENQRKALLLLQNKIDSNISADDIFKRFEEEFDLVHSDFIKRLRAEYPKLTNSETIMCAYIRMNFSSKEMAPLLNISVRGVETMRYRLRKKFDLQREDSLHEFLASFEN